MEPREQSEQTEKVRPAEEQTQPKLSASFFEMLLNPPSCKTTGVCDGCGRCEH